MGSSTPMTGRYTYEDLAVDVAEDFGVIITKIEASAILWEHTGFPNFFHGDPETTLRRQLAAHFATYLVGAGPS